MPICPVCGRDLKNPDSMGHLNSNFHQNALKAKGSSASVEDTKIAEVIKPIKLDPSKKQELKPIKLPPKLDKIISPVPKLQKLELKPLKIEKKTPKEVNKSVKTNENSEYASEEYMDLGIPIVPEPPKKMDKISVKSTSLSSSALERMHDMESEGVKVVLVNCDRCNEIIPIPVPRDMVLNDDLPIVAVSYIHFNSDNKDRHCITIYLDHDFDIRRQRLSSVIIAQKYMY